MSLKLTLFTLLSIVEHKVILLLDSCGCWFLKLQFITKDL